MRQLLCNRRLPHWHHHTHFPFDTKPLISIPMLYPPSCLCVLWGRGGSRSLQQTVKQPWCRGGISSVYKARWPTVTADPDAKRVAVERVTCTTAAPLMDTRMETEEDMTFQMHPPNWFSELKRPLPDFRFLGNFLNEAPKLAHSQCENVFFVLEGETCLSLISTGVLWCCKD